MVRRLNALTIGSLLLASVAASGLASPRAVAANNADQASPLVAYADGKEIPVSNVARYYCDDFEYPVIRCSASQLVASTRTSLTSLLTSIDYVTVFENANYQGAWMNVSQDYPALALLGWNDKISSFKVRNSETGQFFVDWLYGGSTWSFCCNQQLSTLGGYNDTFSSIERT